MNLNKLTEDKKYEFTVRILARLLPKLKSFINDKQAKQHGRYNKDHVVLVLTAIKYIGLIINTKPNSNRNLKDEYKKLLKILKIIVYIPNLLEPTDLEEITSLENGIQNDETVEQGKTI